jgi:hypothetical protein
MRKLISGQHHPGPLSRSKIPTNVAVTPFGLLGLYPESVAIKVKIGREAWKASMNAFDIFHVRQVLSQACGCVLSGAPTQHEITQERCNRPSIHPITLRPFRSLPQGQGPGGLNSEAVTFQRTEASSPRNSWDQWITRAGCERRPRKALKNRGSISSRCPDGGPDANHC